MTHPGGGYTTSWSGSRPPFDPAAASTLGAVRQRLAGERPHPAQPPLTEAERTEAQKAGHCQFCAGIHAGMSTPACPRLATFKLDGDGKVMEGSFWPGTDWAPGRVIFAEDAAEEPGDGKEGQQ